MALLGAQGPLGVGDGRLNLSAMADDASIFDQPRDVGRPELGDDLRYEPAECAPEGIALAQDSEPRQPGLEALEADLLVDAPVVGHGPAPFVIVVRDVLGR